MRNPVTPADGKMLVAAMRRDAREGSIVVSLQSAVSEGCLPTYPAGLPRLALIILATNVTTSENFCISTSKCRRSFFKALSVTILDRSRTAPKLRR